MVFDFPVKNMEVQMSARGTLGQKSYRLFLRIAVLAILLMAVIPMAAEKAYSATTIAWTAPTTNNDGSPLTDLAGYNLYYGTSSGNYTNTVRVGNATTYTLNLAAGSYYFVATAYNSLGVESSDSNQVVKTVLADTTPPNVTALSIPGTSASLTIPINTFVATDNVGVTGYLVNESSTKPSATASGWTSIAPASYTFATVGSKTIYAWARDAAGNVSASTSASVTVALLDTTAPTVPAGFSATAASSTQINLTWASSSDPVVTGQTTSGVAGYKVYSNGTQVATTTGTNYSVAGLTASTAYSFTVSAYDTAGNSSAQSAAATATTLAVADTTAPTVTSFAVPSASTSLTVSVNGLAATDNVGVTGYLINESATTPSATAVGWTSTAPASYAFTTAGSKTIYAWARDASGNVSASMSASVAVTLADTTAPVVALTAPANGLSVSGTVTITATASDNIGVAGVQFKLDGANLGTEDNSSPYSISWDTTAASNGLHTLTAVARDSAGNTTTSGAVSVNVSNSGITTVTLAPTSDSFINIDASNNSTSAELMTYTWPAGSVANTILMKFDLSGIPAGATIQSAALNLYLIDSDTNASYPAYNLSLNRIINHNPNLSLATGYTYDGTNPWTSNTLAYGGIPLAQADISTAYDTEAIDKTAGFKVWNAIQMVKDWLSAPSSNYGLMINSDSTAAADTYRTFASVKNSTVGMRPYMTVTYTYVGGITADTSAPAVTGFTVPTTSSSLSVPITLFTASDNVGVIGYLVNESSTKPSATASGWASAVPSSYAFTTAGSKTLYAWAKDAAGNISASKSATVTITLTIASDTIAPTVTSFTVPSSTTSRTVAIKSFTATDNVKVTGYMITRTSTVPSASATGWTATPPTSYQVSSRGTYTLYSWAKDAAGNVSKSVSATVRVTR